MKFMFGCLAIVSVIATLWLSSIQIKQDDRPIIHWTFGAIAGLSFVLFLALGIWW